MCVCVDTLSDLLRIPQDEDEAGNTKLGMYMHLYICISVCIYISKHSIHTHIHEYIYACVYIYIDRLIDSLFLRTRTRRATPSLVKGSPLKVLCAPK